MSPFHKAKPAIPVDSGPIRQWQGMGRTHPVAQMARRVPCRWRVDVEEDGGTMTSDGYKEAT